MIKCFISGIKIYDSSHNIRTHRNHKCKRARKYLSKKSHAGFYFITIYKRGA